MMPMMCRQRKSTADRDKDILVENIWVGWCSHPHAERLENGTCSECKKYIKPTVNAFNFDYTLYPPPKCELVLSQPTPIALRRLRQKEQQMMTFGSTEEAMRALMEDLRNQGWPQAALTEAKE